MMKRDDYKGKNRLEKKKNKKFINKHKKQIKMRIQMIGILNQQAKKERKNNNKRNKNRRVVKKEMILKMRKRKNKQRNKNKIVKKMKRKKKFTRMLKLVDFMKNASLK